MKKATVPLLPVSPTVAISTTSISRGSWLAGFLCLLCPGQHFFPCLPLLRRHTQPVPCLADKALFTRGIWTHQGKNGTLSQSPVRWLSSLGIASDKIRAQPVTVAHICNLSTQEVEAGGLLQVQSQPGLHSKTVLLQNRTQAQACVRAHTHTSQNTFRT